MAILPDDSAPPEPPQGAELDELVVLLHDELRAMARSQLRREHDRFTLQTTDLVHEAYLRLSRAPQVAGRGRAYFAAAAARAMRQVLIEAARRRGAAKRGAGVRPLELDEASGRVDAFGDELLALDHALRDLDARSPRATRVVECRYFGGMSVEETAEALGVSPRTVKSDWALARAFLFDRLRDDLQ